MGNMFDPSNAGYPPSKRIITGLTKQNFGMQLFQKLSITPLVGARVCYAAFSKKTITP
jgi:hypothetical protein